MNRSDLVPDELKAIERWLVWRPVRRPDGGLDKVPVAKGWNERRQSFDDASRAASRYAEAGLGFYFSDADDIGGIDLDCCRDPATGEITAEWAREVLAAFGSTYAEVSPSGTGVKLLARGCPARGKGRCVMPGEASGGHKRPALEVFATSGFFAITGDRLSGAPSSLTTAEAAMSGWELVRSLIGSPPREAGDDAGEGADWDMLDASALAFYLEGLDVTQHAEHDDWFSIMCAAHRVTGGEPDAMEAFVSWSAGNATFAHLSRQVRQRWRSLKRGPGYGAATMIWELRREGRDDLADSLWRLLIEREDEADAEWQNAHTEMPI